MISIMKSSARFSRLFLRIRKWIFPASTRYHLFMAFYDAWLVWQVSWLIAGCTLFNCSVVHMHLAHRHSLCLIGSLITRGGFFGAQMGSVLRAQSLASSCNAPVSDHTVFCLGNVSISDRMVA